MKHIKFTNYRKVMRTAQLMRLQSLTKEDRKKVNTCRLARTFLKILGIIFFAVITALLIVLVRLIPSPAKDKLLLLILYGTGQVILIIAFIIVVGIIWAWIFPKPMENLEYKIDKIFCAYDDFYLTLLKDTVRNHYGYNENLLVTKCFACSNKLVINQDICLFRVGNQLRITKHLADNYNNHRETDFGCYCIDWAEIVITKVDHNGKRVTKISAKNFEITIGIKAYSFVNKLFEEETESTCN